MRRIGILDLGTNTFHILIVQVNQKGQYSPLLRKRVFVKLGANGVKSIGINPFQRGLKTLKEFKAYLDHYQVDMIKSIGTAALRTADNGPQFVEQVFAETGIKIEIINGIQEAVYIYKGVKQIWKHEAEPALIMDIGGGSVELIVANWKSLIWAESYPIGASVLYRNFHHSDPIHPKEIRSTFAFLDDKLFELKNKLNQCKPKILIGASGTFDVLSDILVPNDVQAYKESNPKELETLLNEISCLSEKERIADVRIPASRVDLIVVACLLIKYLLQCHSFDKIGFSNYSLKEGVIFEIIRNLDESKLNF